MKKVKGMKINCIWILSTRFHFQPPNFLFLLFFLFLYLFPSWSSTSNTITDWEGNIHAEWIWTIIITMNYKYIQHDVRSRWSSPFRWAFFGLTFEPKKWWCRKRRVRKKRSWCGMRKNMFREKWMDVRRHDGRWRERKWIFATYFPVNLTFNYTFFPSKYFISFLILPNIIVISIFFPSPFIRHNFPRIILFTIIPFCPRLF